MSSITQGQYALCIVKVSHEIFVIKTTSLFTTFQSESLCSRVAIELSIKSHHSHAVTETEVEVVQIQAVNFDFALFLNQ